MYLDANILLEILLSRPNEKSARKLLEEQSGEIFISALTAHIVTHFGRSIVELPILRSFLADYTLLSLEASDFEWAFANARDNDFEDALQLAVAIRNGCEVFVTFDKKLANLYKDLIQIKVRLLI
ncbi:PIN domain-containing protein [Candidatus Saccharibacteria bacterium]|nr:MAG: PIN domain-containing protein [Candidatus Saccharibacteria bacterium]